LKSKRHVLFVSVERGKVWYVTSHVEVFVRSLHLSIIFTWQGGHPGFRYWGSNGLVWPPFSVSS